LTQAQVIDGREFASKKLLELKTKCSSLPHRPGLAVIYVGDNPASDVYIKHKKKACMQVGLHFELHRPNANFEELKKCITELNARPDIHGIIVQLPLPKSLCKSDCLDLIAPKKDVDGLTTHNLGLLFSNRNGLKPCTPSGCIQLIESIHGSNLSGLNAVVVGRSELVGKPLAIMLSQKDATVTIAHSKTKNLANVCSQADILVTAIGVPHFFDESYIKKGATVIDVVISRYKGTISGDVNFQKAKERAGAITPVPGGVGPMTILNLITNVVHAYCSD